MRQKNKMRNWKGFANSRLNVDDDDEVYILYSFLRNLLTRDLDASVVDVDVIQASTQKVNFFHSTIGMLCEVTILIVAKIRWPWPSRMETCWRGKKCVLTRSDDRAAAAVIKMTHVVTFTTFFAYYKFWLMIGNCITRHSVSGFVTSSIFIGVNEVDVINLSYLLN